MPERRDLQDTLREAVDRTLRATVETRERAQGAAGGVADAVDDIVKGASRSGRTVRAAVEERLPATQDDIRALADTLDRLERRLAAIEQRLADDPSSD